MVLKNPKTWAAGVLSYPDLNTHLRDMWRWVLGHSLNPQPHAVVTASQAEPLQSGSWWLIPCDTVLRDRGGMSNGLGLRFPQAGVYLIGGSAEFESDTYNKNLRIADSNGAVLTFADASGVGNPTPARMDFMRLAHFEAGDAVTLEGWQDSGLPKLIGLTSQYSPILWAAWYSTDD